MLRHKKSWLLALAASALANGCAMSIPTENTADKQRDALLQRAQAFQRDAKQAPDRLAPVRKDELQQLADDVRAWQARTGRNDIRATEQRVTTARRANDGGGTGNCDTDCPVYTFEGDEICFLDKSECSTDAGNDDLITGTICVYSCISIASNAAR